MRNDMYEILEFLKIDLLESLKQTNITEIFKKLDNMESPVICSGVGGSMPCAIFASKILQEKGMISYNMELLEILQNKNKNNSVLLFSHQGKNYGIKKVIKNVEKSYLLTTRKSIIFHETLLNYKENVKEKSFISIKNTLLPMSILLLYAKREIQFPKITEYSVNEFQGIEIMKDEGTKTSASYLESTIVEANISPVIIHDKYSFCHGRTTTTYYQNNLIIYLISKQSLLDQSILKVLKEHQKQVIILNAFEEDLILADYKLTFLALNLLVQLAEIKKIDLCNIKYAPFASNLYHNQLGDF